jgi:excisionase family DNA binding protein
MSAHVPDTISPPVIRQALLTPNEVCAHLRISKASFYRLADSGALKTVRLGYKGSNGASLRVDVRDLETFLAERRSD